MHTIRRTILLAAAALAAALLLAPVVEAAPRSPYGAFTITYRNTSTYTWQVAEAVAVWNRAGTPFRFVQARPGRRAHVAITQKPNIGGPSSSTAGYGGIGFVWLSKARMKSPRTFHNGQVRIVAHELGHALGLGHVSNRCSIMYSAQDFPTARACPNDEVEWDGRQHCGPRAPDVAALRRTWGVTIRAVPWRGYCTTPTDPARAASGPYVSGSLTGEAMQFPYDSAGSVQLTLTNGGNTAHEVGSYGLVLVDAAGVVIQRGWRFGQWYQAVAAPPEPGASTLLSVPVCNGELPLLMRVRLASQHHDTFFGPVTMVRVDASDGNPSAPANECTAWPDEDLPEP